MPIASSDIKWYLSGGASNTDPNASLGGARSTTQITDATLHNLFDAVSGDESSAGDTEYRCIYIRNEHGSLTWQTVKVWIQTQTPSTDTSVEIALAGEGLNGTAETVGNESTAPSGETFSAPSNYAGGLSIGNMAPNDYHAIWIKRIVGASAAAYNTDSVVIRAQGDTAA